MLKKILRTLAALTIFTFIPIISYAYDLIGVPGINWTKGSKTVNVGTDLAKLNLPSEYIFADGEDAKELMAAVKPKLENIIKNYAYKEGKIYSGYIKGDKVAEVGLAALIVGGTVSKTGLLNKILIIFKKAWIFVLAGIVGLFGKVIRVFRKKPYIHDETELNSDKILFKENSEADIRG